jgi:hypothetical protein
MVPIMDLMGTAMVKATLADGTEVLAVTVKAGTAPEAWRALREAHAETGLWPFLVDPEEPTVLDKLPDSSVQREHHRSAAEIFASAAQFGKGDNEDEEIAEILTFDDDLDLDDEPQANQHSAAAQTTTIGLVPAEYGGLEVPGLLDWSGALGTSGVEHTAVLADWHRRFGAELMTLTGDRIELHVPRPPTEAEEVMRVTMEQAGYCSDILFQCWESVTDMAEWQVNGTLWCFWWD